jgi:putative aminopeptidase FrvX
MVPEEFCQLAARLLRRPAAPYFEHLVREEVEKICAEHGLEHEQDEFGNLLVRLQTDPR